MWGQLQPAEPWSQSYEAKPASAQSLVRRPAKIVNIQRVTSPKYTKYNGAHPLVHGYAPVKYDVDRMNGSWDMRITVRQILLALQIHWAPASSCKIMYSFSWKTASCLHLRLLSSQHGRKQTTSNSFQDCETIVCTANDHNWRVVFFGFYLISHILLFIMVLTCIFFFFTSHLLSNEIWHNHWCNISTSVASHPLQAEQHGALVAFSIPLPWYACLHARTSLAL